jgi:dephospho-CoA kinase
LVEQILPDRDVAIDGLRHPLDYETLRNSFRASFHLIFIEGAPQLRFERLNLRGKYADFDTFHAADSHAVEQKIDSLRAQAALAIHNEGSPQDLYVVVDDAISRFLKEG